MNRTYLCIDLKSFYASVECVERGLDPMTTNLVVADPERSEKTICLAVSPAMKALGVRNRCRVFEIPKNIDYIMASPRMQKYIDYSADIYGIYLEYFSKDDIHVYSIDEVFIDITAYLNTYKLTPRQLAIKLMSEVYERIGVRATCGIGTNLYVTKIALDITAKHAKDFVGELDETSYRERLWDHEPLTDFWRIGPGIAKKLAGIGITTMRGIAEADEDLLYQMFGVDAELLIDHAWGREPVTIADIKRYKPKTNSIGSGQVLMRDYTIAEGAVIVREMMDLLCLQLVEKNLVTSSVTISAGDAKPYQDLRDRGTVRFQGGSNSAELIVPEVVALYERIIDHSKMVRRFNISCNNTTEDTGERQLSMFDAGALTGAGAKGAGTKGAGDETSRTSEDAEHDIQKALIDIKKKFGKNAILKGTNLDKAGTTIERNRQIGGHKSGE